MTGGRAIFGWVSAIAKQKSFVELWPLLRA